MGTEADTVGAVGFVLADSSPRSSRPADRRFDILLLFAYDRGLPNRRCRVSFTDPNGITRVANVLGDSLSEAALAGLAEFQNRGCTDAITGAATRLNVSVESPSTEHEISVGKVRAWLESTGKSPNEQALKVRLQSLLRL